MNIYFLLRCALYSLLISSSIFARGFFDYFYTSDYVDTNKPVIASVRRGKEFCAKEVQTLHKRIPVVQHALETIVGKEIDPEQMPYIGILGSGGGYRAMIAMFGFMRALKKLNIWDAALYTAGLSGSTWTLATHLANPDLSLDELKEFLKRQLAQESQLNNINMNTVFARMKEKYMAGQRITFNDIWGVYLEQVFLPNKHCTLSGLAPLIETGKHPIPLFTAVLDDGHLGLSKDYKWLEFSPFEMGCEDLESWIPVEAFGKRFDNGISDDTAAEQRLGYMLGIFGSAYAAGFPEIVQELVSKIEPMFVKDLRAEKLRDLIRTFRISPPRVFNFMRNLEENPFKNEKYLTVIDAGCAINLPFPPLLRRPLNLLIVCDASDVVNYNYYHALKGIERYARAKNIKFPPIAYDSIGQKKVSLFYDPLDPQVPVVLYFPNLERFSTFKRQYTAAEFEELCGSMEETVIESLPAILKAIDIAHKNQQAVYEQSLTPVQPVEVLAIQ